jgi:hypothetical protein
VAFAAIAALGAAAAAETIPGTFALAGADAQVTGEMQITPAGPMSLDVAVTFADALTGERIVDFTEELTQELHLLAIDSSFSRLVHEHVKAAGDNGIFTAALRFPAPGLYHVYADALPAGMGQQVLRFEVTVGDAEGDGAAAMLPEAFATTEPISLPVGPYVVSVDASRMAANQEIPLRLSVTRNGAPAGDLEPYLGVAAHAVLVRAEDLAYVHAHPVDGSGDGAAHGQDAEQGSAAGDGSGHDHAATPPAANAAEGHGHAAGPTPPAADEAEGHGHSTGAERPAAGVSPDMVLLLTPPGPGRYSLFLEFIGGGEVRTLSVPLEVPAS